MNQIHWNPLTHMFHRTSTAINWLIETNIGPDVTINIYNGEQKSRFKCARVKFNQVQMIGS